jgi:hypothetical protein
MGSDSNSTKNKQVYFGASVIMGLSFWLFAFFFLSLCNKKEHHSDDASGHEMHGHAAHSQETEPKSESKTDLVIDTLSSQISDTTVKAQ